MKLTQSPAAQQAIWLTFSFLPSFPTTEICYKSTRPGFEPSNVSSLVQSVYANLQVRDHINCMATAREQVQNAITR